MCEILCLCGAIYFLYFLRKSYLTRVIKVGKSWENPIRQEDSPILFAFWQLIAGLAVLTLLLMSFGYNLTLEYKGCVCSFNKYSCGNSQNVNCRK